jgi:hypothetical protein
MLQLKIINIYVYIKWYDRFNVFKNLAFRGNESDSYFNRGNYVELIYLMAQRD